MDIKEIKGQMPTSQRILSHCKASRSGDHQILSKDVLRRILKLQNCERVFVGLKEGEGDRMPLHNFRETHDIPRTRGRKLPNLRAVLSQQTSGCMPALVAQTLTQRTKQPSQFSGGISFLPPSCQLQFSCPLFSLFCEKLARW